MTWSGKGRKPVRCRVHKRAAQRIQISRKEKQKDRHKKNRTVSRWDELWLLTNPDGSPKAVRRERRFVWGASNNEDGSVINGSGVFHPVGQRGLPNEGMSTNDKSLQGLIYSKFKALKEDQAATEWLKENPTWWRFEEFAHDRFSANVRDLVSLHGRSLVRPADEQTTADRCSFCCEHKEITLAGEFCSEGCFTDYVKTFGAQDINLGVSNGEDLENAGRLAQARGELDDAVV